LTLVGVIEDSRLLRGRIAEPTSSSAIMSSSMQVIFMFVSTDYRGMSKFYAQTGFLPPSLTVAVLNFSFPISRTINGSMFPQNSVSLIKLPSTISM